MEELKNIFGTTTNNRPATHADLQGMKYTELVLKEAMRLYTPSPLIGRTLHEDIAFGGRLLNQY